MTSVYFGKERLRQKLYKKIEKEPGDTRSDEEYCNDLATVKGGQLKHGSVYDISGYCFAWKLSVSDLVMQNSSAVEAGYCVQDLKFRGQKCARR